jgi:S1-C subfamily serine protease
MVPTNALGVLVVFLGPAIGHRGEDFPPKLQVASVLATVQVANPLTGELGSGVLVHQQGDDYYIVTAYHVIENTDVPTVHTFSAFSFPKVAETFKHSQVIARDKVKDLAVIRISGKGQKYQVLPLAPANLVPQENNFPCLVTGCTPAKMPGKEKVTVVQKKRVQLRGQEPKWVWEVNSPQAKGWSGGALVDQQGYVIGIASGSSDRKGYFAHTLEIHGFLDQNALAWLYKKAK